MGLDLPVVFGWWFTLFVLGIATFPFIRIFFRNWFDQGYFLTKSAGLMLVTFGAWWLASLHVLAFSWLGIVVVAVTIFGLAVYKGGLAGAKDMPLKTLMAEEIIFIVLLWGWVWVKGHEPSIHGLEKFMDFGFAKSIYTSKWLPAEDMWYKGEPINYYYFGHTMMAVLSKLSQIDLVYGYNLMLCTLFALCGSMSFGITYQLCDKMKKNWRIFGATMAAVFVTLGGNLHTIYAFTVGYDGEHPVPFWQIMTQPKAPFINSNETNDPRFTDFEWNIYWDKDKQAEVQPDLKDRFGKYWYPNATRFIPFTIHEFPSYSFVVSWG
jgi:uncharacterized membrane protein